MRKPSKSLVYAALAAAAFAGPALADDNGMTAHYGDSWADLQAHNPNLDAVPSLQAQEDAVDARTAWGHARDRVRANTQRMREATSNTFHRMTGTSTTTGTAAATTTTTTAPASVSGNQPDPQAAPAAYSATPVAPGPAAIDAGANAPAPRSTPRNPGTERAGPLGSGTTNSVDPTGVGAATMGGSPYGGNQDPARLPESGSNARRY